MTPSAATRRVLAPHQIFDAWLEYERFVRGISPESDKLYRFHLRRFRSFLALEELNGKPLEGATIERFLAALKARGVGDHSRFKAYSVLHTAFGWAVRRGMLDRDPCRDLTPPRVRDLRPKIWLPKPDILKLLAAVRDSDQRHAGRDHALLSCCYFALLRINEACRLRLEWVDLERGTLHVLGKGDRAGVVPVHRELAPVLRRWLRVRAAEPAFAGSPWLFPALAAWHKASVGPVDTFRIRLLLRRDWLPASGLVLNVTPHTLRRSFANHLRRLGVRLEVLQRLLRHKKLETTRIYLGEDPDELRGDIDRG